LLILIGPTTPYSSVEHGKFKYVGYTGVFNIVDYAAVSFPCGVTVGKEIDRSKPRHRPHSDLDKEIHAECKFYLFLQQQVLTFIVVDSQHVVHGMPVSLQLVARRLEEEKVLEMTREIIESLNKAEDLHARSFPRL
jgi:amidase